MLLKPGLCYLLLVCFIYLSCKNDTPNQPVDQILDIRIKEDPRSVNPVLYNGSVARLVHQYLFLPLADYHPETFEIIPILIKEIPEKEFLDEGKVAFSMKIREEATWDNGSPITADDYLFTLKVILHPQSSSSFFRGFYQDLEEVRTDTENPKSIQVTFFKDYLLSRDAVLSIPILPKYVYDPNSLFDQLSIAQLKDNAFMEEFMKDNTIFSDYIKDLNGPKYGKETIQSSGPYQLVSWESDQSIVLEKKNDYWGAPFSDNPYLKQGPEKMIFYIIPDETTVLSQLKEGTLDVSNAFTKNNFSSLLENVEYRDDFTFHSPTLTRYYYLLINNQDPILADPNVRKALAYLLDIEKIIENLDKGYGTRTASLVHPVKSYYNKELEPIPFNPNQAALLLKNSGWSDVDNDGDLDKTINGVLKELTIDMYVNEGELGKNVGLLLQENGKQIGLNINIITKPFSSIYREHVLKRDFGITPFSTSLGPELDDFYTSWHSDNTDPGESNFSGYRDEEADRIIEAIRTTRSDKQRIELYKELQSVVQEDMPVIFMYAPTETIVVSNRWIGSATSKRPGYLANTFIANK